MSIIECPECRKEVSEWAAQCPHCGYPLLKEGVPPPFSKPKDVSRPSRMVKAKARPVYIAIAAVVFILGGVFLYHNFQVLEKKFTSDLGMEFVLIPAGSFMMGANPNFEEASSNETPQHKVTISQPFYLGVYEVTQEQWVSVMGGNNPSEFIGRSNPVENVSWDDVQVFIRRLNQNESRGKFRLPTEAEWEYASRAGKSGAYFFGDDAGELGQYAWYGDNSGKTHPVGQKQPNPWGLYDIYGNVVEWVEDWYGEEYYANSPATDPKGPSNGSYRVPRGGGWGSPARICRSAFRIYFTPDYRFSLLGFRLAFSPSQ